MKTVALRFAVNFEPERGIIVAHQQLVDANGFAYVMSKCVVASSGKLLTSASRRSMSSYFIIECDEWG